MADDLIVTITNAGIQAAKTNTPDRNGFTIKLSYADVYVRGVKKGRFNVTGLRSGSNNQVVVRATIFSNDEEYSYDEVRLIDGFSGVVFATVKRQGNAVFDFVSSLKRSMLVFALTLSGVSDGLVTINVSDNMTSFVELDEHLADPDAHSDLFNSILNTINGKNSEINQTINNTKTQLTNLLNSKSDELSGDMQELINSISNALVPPSTVNYIASSTVPDGWLAANGAAVSRTTYAKLFAAIGTRYGAGDGSTTFNLPDLRGEFIRGVDNGRGVDSGRSLGSSQGDAIPTHYHGVGTCKDNANSENELNLIKRSWSSSKFYSWLGGMLGQGTSRIGSIAGGQVSTADETIVSGEARPRNIALLAIIKY